MVAAGATAVMLAGLVAAASQGTPVWIPLREGHADRVETMTRVAVVLGVGMITAFAITVTIHHLLLANRSGRPRLRTTLLRTLPITTVALALLSLLAIARTDLEGSRGEPVHVGDRMGGRPAGGGSSDPRAMQARAGEGKTGVDEKGSGEPDRSALFAYQLLVLGAVATAIVGAVVWSWTAKRTTKRAQLREDEGEPDPDYVTAHGAVARTIDMMLADPDPNTAIIGAYARLLEGLTACGIGRRDHEAPKEHLHRALTLLNVRPKPLYRLTGLFEIARFSTRPLASAHRDEALDALRSIAAELAAVSRTGGAER